MRQRALFLSAVLLLATACSSSDGDGSGGSVAAGGAGGTGGSNNPTGAGNGDPGTGGAGAASNGKTVTITMDEFDVGNGEEVYRCQNFANPFDGDAEIGEFESSMSPGSHHLLLFYKKGVTDSPIESCSGLEFAATPYGSQQPKDSLAFPDGIAAKLPSDTGFRLQAHYLNTTGATIHAKVEVTFHLDDPAKVKAHAGVLFIIQPNISIAPDSTGVVTYDCNLPLDMNILRASSHMHRHGTKFTSTIAGTELYDTTVWSEPQPQVYTPPRAAKAGDPLHFECKFVNDTPNTLHFGESASTDEMCILTAPFYPAPDGVVTVGCGNN